jgi:hypothetical protein
MNRIRPFAGALLATLLCVPAFAAEVELLPPGGGLAPPINKTGPADDPSGTGRNADRHVASRATTSSSTSNDYPEPVLQTRHFGLQVELSCQVASQPNALEVVNHSAEDLPPGTRIKWQIKSEGKVGYFALLGELPGGETLVADNVLPEGAQSGAGCIARVI